MCFKNFFVSLLNCNLIKPWLTLELTFFTTLRQLSASSLFRLSNFLRYTNCVKLLHFYTIDKAFRVPIMWLYEKNSFLSVSFIFVYVKLNSECLQPYSFLADYAYHECIFCNSYDFPFDDNQTREKITTLNCSLCLKCGCRRLLWRSDRLGVILFNGKGSILLVHAQESLKYL